MCHGLEEEGAGCTEGFLTTKPAVFHKNAQGTQECHTVDI